MNETHSTLEVERATRSLAATGLRPSERASLAAVALAMAGFGVFGFATGAPSTLAYLCTVGVVAMLTLVVWDPEAPPLLAPTLALLAVAHLAGGLVRVGDDVLYNASLGSPVLRYDHAVHASGVFLGTVVLWTVFGRSTPGRAVVVLCVLAGLGLGALNETVEFLSTLAHDGSHVGGYSNTGWDLVSNVAGGLGAARFIATRSQR